MTAALRGLPAAWATTAKHLSTRTPGLALLACALHDLNDGVLRGVLTDPGSASPDRVRTYVLNWVAENVPVRTGSVALEDACCALELLEIFLSPHERRKRRTYLAPEPGPGPVPDSFAYTLRVRVAVDKRLPDTASGCTSDEVRVGLLIYLLVTRAAQCHTRLLGAALLAIATDQPLVTGGQQSWVVVDVDLHGKLQRRRILLDAVCVAAWCATRDYLIARLGAAEPRTRMRVAAALVRRCWTKFVGAISGRSRALPALNKVMAAVAARVAQQSVPLLGAYASGTVASTSWAEENWHALRGLARVRGGYEGTQAPGARSHESAFGEVVHDAASCPVDDAFHTQLLDAIGTARDRTAAVERLTWLLQSVSPETSRGLVIRWLLYLVRDARNKGKPLEVSTVRGYCTVAASRLVAILPERLSSISAEEFGELLDEVVDSATSAKSRRRLRELIRRFNAFRIRENVGVEGTLELPSREAGECDVSARYVTEEQYLRALAELRRHGGSSAMLEARVFLILGYRLGLRRTEVLGLMLKDVRRGDPEYDLIVRPNPLRDLKTSNAARRLPLALLTAAERAELGDLRDVRVKDAEARGVGANEMRDYYLFFGNPAPTYQQLQNHAADRVALNALRLVTGDHAIHVHHLRHSFGSRNALGAVIRACPRNARALLPDFMRSMPWQSRDFHRRQRARRDPAARAVTAVSTAMGHGSDATTMEYYVHGLDQVLHAVVTASLGARRTARGDRGTDDPSFSDGKLMCGLLQLSPATRPTGGAMHAWLRSHCRRRGVRVLELSSSQSLAARTATLHLEWALASPALTDLPGRPTGIAARRIAGAVLTSLRRGIETRPDCAAVALVYLTRESADAGWIALQHREAAVLREAYQAAFPEGLRLEYRSAGRHKRALATKALGKALREGTPMEVRVRRPAPHASSQRYRCWPTVAWALKAAEVWMTSCA